CRAKETPLNSAPAAAPQKVTLASESAPAPALATNRSPSTTGSRPIVVESPTRSAPVGRTPSVYRPPEKRSPVPLVIGAVVVLVAGLGGAYKLHLIGPKPAAAV